MSNVPVELIVAAFQDEGGAEEALQELKAAKKEGLIKIDNTAILKKDANGKIHIKEAKDMGGGKGAVIGGVVGGIVGLIAGPAAIVTAGIGAAIGGFAAKLSDGGFDDKWLKELGGVLENGRLSCEDTRRLISAIGGGVDLERVTPLTYDLTRRGALAELKAALE